MRIKGFEGSSGNVVIPLIFAIAFGLLFFIPSRIIDLRGQESIFPLIAVSLFLFILVFDKIDRATGIFLVFITLLTILRFIPESWDFLKVVTIYGAFYLVLVLCYPEIYRSKNILYNTLCVIALANVLWIILQSNGINIFFVPKARYKDVLFRPGLFANTNETSIFLAMTIPCFLRKHWHWGIVPMIAGLMMTKVSNGFLAVGLIAVIYLLTKFWDRKRTLLAFLMGLAVLMTFFFAKMDRPSCSSRIEAWKRTTHLIRAKPLLGWGIGQTKYMLPLFFRPELLPVKTTVKLYKRVLFREDFKKVFLKKYSKKNRERLRGRFTPGEGPMNIWRRTHNEYLQVTLEMGLVGLGLMLLVMVSHTIAFVKTKKKDIIPFLACVVAGFTAISMFVFQIGRLTFLTIIMMAMIQGERLLEREV